MRLDELRVIEFGSYLAGPLVGKYLADAGLHVISVAKPLDTAHSVKEHDYMKHTWHDLHRGKERITIDLKKNVATAKALIKDCSVLVENLSAGAMERLGLGYEECRRLNPNLIYLSLPAYNTKDANFAGLKGWDSIVMATSGVFADMGLNRTLLGVKCSFSGLHMPSVYASLYAAFAIVSAVFDPSLGRRIEVPLASSLLEALVHNTIEFPLDDSYKNLRQLHICQKKYPIAKADLDMLVDPFFAKYECSDRRPIYIVCPSHTRHQERLLQCLGVYEEVCQIIPPKKSPYTDKSSYHGFGSGRLTQREANIVRPLLERAISSRSSTEWEQVLGAASVPCIAHKTTEEWKTCAHARASGLIGTDGEIGPVQWHTVIKKADRVCQKTFKQLKVIDLTNVIAGPTIGAMLARLGAEVIKIDPVRPMYGPTVTIIYGVVVNIGKKSMLLDIASSEGRSVLNELLRDSDVLLINSTTDALKRIGLTHRELTAINADIILLQFDAWSGMLEAGAFANYIGYDDNVQAGIGIMERFGGDLENAEEHAHIGTIDVIAGVAGSLSVVLALLRRRYEKVISTARTSLAAVGQYLQYIFMFDRRYDYIGKGVTCKGFHALHRYYETADGHVMLVAALGADQTTVDVLYRRMFGSSDSEVWCRSRRSDDVISHLRQFADVSVAKIDSLTMLKKKHTLSHVRADLSYQFLEQCDHPIGRLVIVPPVAISFDAHLSKCPYAPKYGADTRDLLARYSKTHILLTGNASVAYSRNYIPFTQKCGKCHTVNAVVQLHCNHKFCHLCMCVAKGRCYTCQEPHEMDVDKIRQIVVAWSQKYNMWRRGATSGSRDIHRLLQGDGSIARSNSCPSMNTRRQSTSLTSTKSSCAFVNSDNNGLNA